MATTRAQRYVPDVSVHDVQPHPRNPRVGRTDLIEESIEVNGFYGALVVQESTGYVLAGNHRLLAARNAGEETVPVFYLDVDDIEAKRLMLADNRTADLAGYLDDELASLLGQLAASQAGLAGTGFADSDLAELLEQLNPTATAIGDIAALDRSGARTCPYCDATWVDTAAGPERVEPS